MGDFAFVGLNARSSFSSQFSVFQALSACNPVFPIWIKWVKTLWTNGSCATAEVNGQSSDETAIAGTAVPAPVCEPEVGALLETPIRVKPQLTSARHLSKLPGLLVQSDDLFSPTVRACRQGTPLRHSGNQESGQTIGTGPLQVWGLATNCLKAPGTSRFSPFSPPQLFSPFSPIWRENVSPRLGGFTEKLG